MVRVRDALPRTSEGSVDAAAWHALVCAEYPQLDHQVLEEALQLLASLGDPELLEAGVDLAQLLLELQLDIDALVVGLLYRAWRQSALDVSNARGLLNVERMELIASLDRMGEASRMSLRDDPMQLSNSEDQVQNVRLLLESLIDDARVALIKLAERVVVLRFAKNASPTRKERLGRESLELFAPLAARLGLWRLKWAVEDLGFRYLEPQVYQDVARQLDGRRDDRERRVMALADESRNLLKKSGLDAKVTGRAKHIYSIWRKMQQKGLEFGEVYDTRALRVIVATPADCYRALGVIHAAWHHLPEEFDDYIANPKDNGYQSIHTAVVGPQGHILEVQIRTDLMHTEAEFGVCAHWSYKDSARDTSREMPTERIVWLRQLLELHDAGEGQFETLLAQRFDDVRIYVSTPQGHVLDLPRDATPIDFAYRVHTDVGHQARGAIVDGEPYPLSAPLKSGQRVEIVTANHSEPERDWLESALGFVRTARARAKILNWFRHQDKAFGIALGERMWRTGEDRLAMKLDARAIAEGLALPDSEALFLALGRGELGVGDVLLRVPTPYRATGLTLPAAPGERGALRAHVYIAGQAWPIGLGLCCRPLEQDRIVGYLDDTDAVIAHKPDCVIYQQAARQHPLRVIALSWERNAGKEGVRIGVRGRNRQGLLRDITQVLGQAGVGLVGTKAKLDGEAAVAVAEVDVQLDCETVSLTRLALVLGRLLLVPDVLGVTRLD